MSSFLGTYNISLDEKGRFNVPAKFRGTLEQSGPQLVVCAMEPFLVVFPLPFSNVQPKPCRQFLL